MADTAELTSISVEKPAPGQTVDLAVSPGHAYVLDFEPSSAMFEKQGDSLHIDFENGGTLHLQCFFSSLRDGGFHLVMPDGAAVNAKDLADALLMPIEEIAPRAGAGTDAETTVLALEDILDVSPHPPHPGDFSAPSFASILDPSLPAAEARLYAVSSPVSASAGADVAEELLATYLRIGSL